MQNAVSCPCQESRLPTSYLLLRCTVVLTQVPSNHRILHISGSLLPDRDAHTKKMAPSQIQIAISVLQRLLKEEQSYYKEQEQQEARITKLENQDGSSDENHEYQLKQEVGHMGYSKAQKWLNCSLPQSRVGGTEEAENVPG